MEIIMNHELEELMKEKRRIEAQIKVIKSGMPVTYGCARLSKVHYPTKRPDEYGIYVRRNLTDVDYSRESWNDIIKSTKKDDAIKAIPKVIEDLQGLYDKLMEEIEGLQEEFSDI